MSSLLDATLPRLSRWLRIDGLDAPEHRAAAKWALGLAALGMLLRIIFWAYTHRYWEDALITCLHSENFVLGLGMTHVRPGEPPLHGFTSPLSVLVPLLGDLMHVGFGVDFIKLVSIPASALTVLYLLGICIHRSVSLPLPLAVMVMGYAAVEHHQILWGMAGMETQLATLVIVASLYHCIAWHPARLGVWLGLCMLARPDYAFWCAILGVYGLFRDWRRMPLVVGVALAVYLPWILFCFAYYGSPIPNTIIAKGLGYKKWYHWENELNAYVFARRGWRVMTRELHVMLGPTFCGHGAGIHRFFSLENGSLIGNTMFGFAVAGAAIAALRRQWVLWPLAAAALVYSLYFCYLVPVIFGWYKMGYLLLLLLLGAWGIHQLFLLLPAPRLRRAALWTGSLGYLAAFLCVLPWTFHTERQIQRYVEDGLRMQAGLYLKEHMKPGEAVGCEPLGYMAYYSRGEVYDFPGLANRKVVAWSKQQTGVRTLENMLKALQPEYLFLRDREMNDAFEDPQWFRDRYHVVKVFEVAPEDIARMRWTMHNIDFHYRIYKKNHPGDESYDAPLWPAAE